MKLSQKIPLAFFTAMLLMLAGALYGIWALNQSIDVYRTNVQSAAQSEQMASQMLITFKVQVQEWKDTLLRGKDPVLLDKHWSAFQKQERAVDALALDLKARLPEGESQTLVDKFAAAHTRMGVGYRKGYDAFTAANFVPSAGDNTVAGVDREPSALLAQAAQRIGADSALVAAKAAHDASEATWISIALMMIVAALTLLGGVLFSRTISRPLGRALGCATAVASGDLTMTFDASGKDEIAELLSALIMMQKSLSIVVSEVRQNAEGVAMASAEIASGNVDLSSRTEEQAASLGETAASMEELTATVRQNAENARQAASVAGAASEIATRGGSVMDEVVVTMHGISDGSKKVGEIIAVIDSIAFQTNILALNAAVEAARAGEQGRGFAVVATEVRMLAQRSATAAKEIKLLVEQSSARVDAGSLLIKNASSTITDIVGSVRRVNDIVGEISSSSAEQSRGIEQVNMAVAQMDEVTQQNAALVEEASAAAHALSSQADSLRDAVSVFKIAGDTAGGEPLSLQLSRRQGSARTLALVSV